ncbi:UrcA family protein [Sphingopyxis sp. YR583]|uniref:UrcA family protein n=1 Tax=Sphingopyxis sp. YR583 TaxID=1881047 RepID=UPI0008A726B3|nr:UrcA family protein [Sphingopyxis sp. YR583]SEH11399.1 UrcA family protein [Sphingopyxis sp. YR583]
MTRTLSLALSLTAIAMPAAAQAEETATAVRIDNLDLTRAGDRGKLDARLKSAARKICDNGVRGAAENSRRAACVSAALTQVEPQAQRAIAQAQGGTRLALLMVRTAR